MILLGGLLLCVFGCFIGVKAVMIFDDKYKVQGVFLGLFLIVSGLAMAFYKGGI